MSPPSPRVPWSSLAPAIGVAAAFVLGWLWILSGSTCERWVGRVVVYTSLDELYSAPILREFERRTSIRVDVVYDTEASKTVGLANRLRAEARTPRADVFWNSEILHTIRLRDAGVLEPYLSPSAKDIPAEYRDPAGYWTGFAARARVIAVTPAVMRGPARPRGLGEMALEHLRGSIGMADPRFGTTATHLAVLHQVLGRRETVVLLERLEECGLRLYPGNGPVAEAVARGEISAGLTDTDDVWIRKDRGATIDLVYPDHASVGTLVIPNTVALIKGGPNPDHGRRLIDFLLSRSVEEKLARARGRQIPVRDLPVPEGTRRLRDLRTMKVDWSRLPADYDAILPDVKRLLLD